ncbi:amidase signature enzyme [Sporormia fimetaria CBS 119925]|uniref:Amidase signature enzyme n=1 Tax=Sporormia fimetaria CBS 119925 TaxID=1340428 RepID=A0A6A6VLC7_9PLEO|nr:amidase signature enzyme [Sporormia fimetaria CBS 119925]
MDRQDRAQSAQTSSFINYPTPQAHDVPYKAGPEPANPVVKGALLNILASVITTVPYLPSFLYANAGFPSLRKIKELDNVEARFEPVVIPTAAPNDEPLGSYTDVHAPHVKALLAKKREGGFYTIADFHDAYKRGSFTPVDVVIGLLPLIRRDVSDRSPHSTAFIDSKLDLVRQAAEKSAQRWKEGKPLGLLDGVPFAVKDEMDVKAYKRFVGTKHDFTEGKEVETSWCVRMLEEEGAIMIGKTNMHEIGMDVNNNNPNWGTPRNPNNQDYYCGGSSGGSAYAVASGLVPFAIGADGGGSIRIPSNFCGLYGLKPTHGRVSIAPCLNFANTNTVQGPLAANMLDLAISFRVLSKPDPSNSTSRHFAPPRPLSSPTKKTLGVYKPWFDRADPEVQEHCSSALRYFSTELGYKLVDISIPFVHEGQLAHAMTIMSEAHSSQLRDTSYLTAANRVLLKVSQQTPAADWLLAQRLRHLIMQHLAHLFQTHPDLIIITPTTPNAGWPIQAGEMGSGLFDGNTQIRTMEYVWLANFTGVPAIQFPVGYAETKHGDGKVPVGMCGHGEWGSEESLIQFGFDGEKWLHEGYKEGRKMPGAWVDVLKGATRT